MAVISCPECAQPVSDRAPTCPHCGYVLNPGNDPAVDDLRWWRLVRFLVGFLFLALLVTVVFILSATTGFR